MSTFKDDEPVEICGQDTCSTRQSFPEPTGIDEYGYCDDHLQWWKVERVVPETPESMTPRDEGEQAPEPTALEWQRTSDVPARIKVKKSKKN